MADNIATTPGSGATIAADDVGGVLHQRVKIGVGNDGTSVDMGPPGDGLTDAPVLPAGTLVWDNAASRWNRLRRPVDTLGVGSAAAVNAMVYNGTTLDIQRSASGDALAATGLAASGEMLYNGATWDRQRGNTEGTLLASAARTTSTQSATQTNYNARGVIITANITAAAGGGQTLTPYLYAIDPVTTAGFGLALFTAFATTGAQVYVIYPGAVDTMALGAAEVQAVPLSRSWAFGFTHSGAGSWTYSVGYSLVI